ncbi:LamG-like jellyroll fold domain-containing protein [Marinoscillum sp.]|uniref:LamG-like jellyroll fold domain-containing protein n=1 Tax=Marinoscillum sp. TaxID=2024838 RepID=UPI003BAC4F6E
MKSYRVRLLAFFTVSLSLSLSSFGQTEICNNGIDDDGDGYIDCYDNSCSGDGACDDFYVGNAVVCQEEPTSIPTFKMKLQWGSENETADTYGTPMIGDLDGNGIPEVVTVNWLQQKMYILNGATGATMNTINVPFDPLYQPVIGNVMNDECAWIFVTELDRNNLANSFTINAYDCNGDLQWSKDATKLYGPGIPGLADFNQDGVPELYYKNEIRNAQTGDLLVAGTGGTYDWYYEVAFGVLALDVLPDAACSDCSGLELITGSKVYSVNIGAGTITERRDMNDILNTMGETDYEFRYYRTAISAADYNLDGNVDIIMPGAIDNSSGSPQTTVFLWDVANGTVDFYQDAGNNWNRGTGRINIADIDNDGLMNAVYVSGEQLYALDENLDFQWSIGIKETSSGFTGCTLFDFNGDGAFEIIYRSEESILVITTPESDPTNPVISAESRTCVSRTAEEYPVVADVDGDGASEICVTCTYSDATSIDGGNWTNTQYAHVRVFEADGEVWQPARSVWNQHAYFNVNVNDDLSIPSVQQDHTRIFGTVDCITGVARDVRPLNGFLNQSTIIGEDGCPSYVSPDINMVGNISSTMSICPDNTFEVTFDIANTGDTDISGNLPITFYDGDPTVDGSTQLNTQIYTLSNLEVGETETVTLQVQGSGGAFDLYISLNDYGGTPAIIPGNSAGIVECDPDNNIDSTPVTYTPFSLTVNKLNDNRKCEDSKPDNGEAEAYFEGTVTGGTENIWVEDFGDPSLLGKAKDETGTTEWSSTNTSGYTPDFYGVGTSFGDNAFEGEDTGDGGEQGPVNWTSESIDISNHTDIAISVDLMSTSQCDGSYSYYRDRIQFWYNIDGSGDILMNPDDQYGDFSDGSNYYHATASGLNGSNVVLKARIITTGNNEIMAFDNVKVSGTASDVTKKFTEADGYTFNWYNQGDYSSIVSTGSNYSNMAEGTYEVVGLYSASNCYSDTLEITIDRVVPTFEVWVYEIEALSSCVTPDGVIGAFAYTSLNGSGEPADSLFEEDGYSFNWNLGSDPGGLVIGTGDTISNLEGGSYFVTVLDNLTGCESAASGDVSSAIATPDFSEINTSLTHITTCGGTGEAEADVNGSTAGYDFEWYIGNNIKATPDFTTSTITGLAAGDYLIRIREQSSECVSIADTITILDNSVQPQPTITTVTENSSCDTFNGHLSADGDGAGTVTGYTFEWWAGSGIVSNNKLPGAISGASLSNNDSEVSGIPGGNYTLRVTKDGCSTVTNVVLTENAITPEFSAIEDTIDTGDAFIMGGSDTNSAWISTPQKMDGLSSFTIQYWVDLTSTNYGNDQRIFGSGGSDASQVLLWSDNHDGIAFIVDTYSGRGRINSGYSATGWVQLTGTWDNSTGEMILYADGVQLGSTTVGSGSTVKSPYSFMRIGRDQRSNKQFVGTIDEVRLYNRALDIDEISQTRCIELTGTESGLIMYYDFNNITSASTTVTDRATADGSDDGTIMSSGFGTGTNPHNVKVADITCPEDIADHNTSCDASNPNGSVNIGAYIQPDTANYDFTLYSGFSITGTPLEVNSTGLFEGLDEGFYTIVAENQYTTCVSVPVTVSINNIPDHPNIATTIVDDNGCNGTGSGQIIVTSTSNEEEPTGYTYRIYDGWNSTTQIGSDVAVSNGVVGHTFTGLEDGNYRIEVINDDLTCSSYEDVNVGDDSTNPTVTSITRIQNQSCDTGNGQLTVNMPSSASNYTFAWYTGEVVDAANLLSETSNVLSGLSSTSPSANGKYTVVATLDSTGCETAPATRTMTDNFSYPDVVISEVQPQNGCGAGAGANGIAEAYVDVAGSEETVGYTFEWSTDGVNFTSPITSSTIGTRDQTDATLAGGTTYFVRVTDDATGCSVIESITIGNNPIEPILSEIAASNQDNTGCNTASYDGEAEVAVSWNGSTISNPATSGYTFYWEYSDGTQVTDVNTISGSDTENPTGLPDDTYKIAVQAPNGCTSDTLLVIIDHSPLNNATLVQIDPNTGCTIGNGSIRATGDGSTATIDDYDFEWFRGNTTNAADSIPGPGSAIPYSFYINDLPNEIGGLDGNQVYTVRITSKITDCVVTRTITVDDDAESPLQVDETKIAITAATSCGPNPGGEVDISAIVDATSNPGFDNENGSFELPDMTNNPNTGAGGLFYAGPQNNPRQAYYDEGLVPGWVTDDRIDVVELYQNGYSADGHSFVAYEGVQWAELNADSESALYFDMQTQPGTTMTWRFAHRARRSAGANQDCMRLRIGETGTTIIDNLPEIEVFCSKQVNDASNIPANGSSTLNGWVLYEGTYEVPAGQYFTRFAYQAVSSSRGSTVEGNFIDGVEFFMDPFTFDGELTDGSGSVLQDNNDGVFDSLAAGTYSLRVTDNYTGCVSDPINVVVPDEVPEISPVASNKVDNIVCDPSANRASADDYTGGIQFDPTTEGTNETYSFSLETAGGTTIANDGSTGGNYIDVTYSTSGSQSVVSGLPQGNYVMNIVDNDTDCEIDHPFTIGLSTTDPSALTADIATVDNTSCVDGNYTGTATVEIGDISDGAAYNLSDYEFFWATAADQATQIDDDEVLDDDANGNSGVIDGDYILILTNMVTGCTSDPIDVTIDPDQPTLGAGVSALTANAVCDSTANDPANPNATGAITFTPTGGTGSGNFSFALETAGGTAIDNAGGTTNYEDVAFTNSGVTTTTVTGLHNGNYIMTITDETSGCEIDHPFTIGLSTTDPSALTADIATVDNTSCVDGNYTGTATVEIGDISDGAAYNLSDYEFFWATAADQATQIDDDEVLDDDANGNSGVIDGDYILILTNMVTGCTSDPIDVTIDPDQPTLGAGVSALTANAVCDSTANDPANPNATGAITFTPTGGTGSGNFSFALETAGGTAIDNAGGTTNYEDVAFTNSGVTTTTVTGLHNGNYIMTITDETSGCEIDHPFTIGLSTTDPSALTADIATVDNTSCVDGNYTGTATVEIGDISDGAAYNLSDYEFFWATAADQATQIDDDEVLDDDANGNSGVIDGDYILILTNMVTGCTSDPIDVTIDPDQPTLGAGVSALTANAVCDSTANDPANPNATGAITFTPTGGTGSGNFSFALETAGGTAIDNAGGTTNYEDVAFTNSGVTTTTVTGLHNGNYIMTITDETSGCEIDHPFTIGLSTTDPSALTADIATVDNTSCVDGNYTGTATVEIGDISDGAAYNLSDYEFFWATAADQATQIDDDEVLDDDANGNSGVIDGDYILILTNMVTGCTSDPIDVTIDPDQPTLGAGVSALTANAVCDSTANDPANPNATGAITFTPTGGTGSGNFSFALETAGGTAIDNAGGTTNYEDVAFTNSGVTTTTVTGLHNGNYIMTITDETSGCEIDHPFTIGLSTTDPSALTADIATVDNTSCVDGNYTGTATVEIGDISDGAAYNLSDYEFFWATAADQATQIDDDEVLDDDANGNSGVIDGDYILILTNMVTGCTSDPIDVTIDPDQPTLGAGVSALTANAVCDSTANDPANPNATGAITFTPTGGTGSGNFSFALETAGGTAIDNAGGTTNYEDVAFTNSGVTTTTVTGLHNGNYIMTITDETSGCEIDHPFTIGLSTTDPSALTADIATVDNTSCVDGNYTGTATVEIGDISDGAAYNLSDYEFFWATAADQATQIDDDEVLDDDANGNSGVIDGDYILILTNMVTGCTSDPIDVTIDPDQPTLGAGVSALTANAVCDSTANDPANPNATGAITFTPTGGTGSGNFSFALETAGGTAIDNAGGTTNYEDVAFTNSGVTTTTVTGLHNGNYIMTITDETSGCEIDHPFTIGLSTTDPSALTADIATVDNTSCVDGNYTGTATVEIGDISDGAAYNLSDYEFFWATAADQATQIDDDEVLDDDANGNSGVIDGDYILILTNMVTGCTSDPIDVTIDPDQPTLGAGVSALTANAVCDSTANDPANPNATGAITFTPTGGTGSGNFSFALETAGGTAIDNAGGTTNYEDVAFTNSGVTTTTVTGLHNGNYIMTITDETSGCEIDHPFTIGLSTTDPSALTADIATVDNTSCVDGNYTGTATVEIGDISDGAAYNLSDYEFFWATAADQATQIDDDEVLDDDANGNSGVIDGDYILILTNMVTGCTSDPIDVTIDPDQPTLGAGVSALTANAVCDSTANDPANPNATGAITFTPTGGTGSGNFSFALETAGGTAIDNAGGTTNYEDVAFTNSGVTTTTVTGLHNGNYIMTITDETSGCEIDHPFTIGLYLRRFLERTRSTTDPSALTADIATVDNTSCVDGNYTGTATVEIGDISDGAAYNLSDYE